MGARRNIRLLRIVQALVGGANEGEGRKERTDMSDEFNHSWQYNEKYTQQSDRMYPIG